MRTSCVAGSNHVTTCAILVFCAMAPLAGAEDKVAGEKVVVHPERVELRENFSRAQLLVTSANAEGNTEERFDDLTATATYESSNPAVVTVSPAGQLLAVGNGQATIAVITAKARLK